MNKENSKNFAEGLKTLTQIIKMGTIIIMIISLTYILAKLPTNEIKSALTYYYAEALVLEGHEERLVSYTSESGNKISLSALTIVGNPLILLSKQQFNWVVIKGVFIGYITFKIFCLVFLLSIYIRRKIKIS